MFQWSKRFCKKLVLLKIRVLHASRSSDTALCMLYSHIIHMPLYRYTCRNILNTIKTSDTVLRKIYLSLYLKVLCVRGSQRRNKDCNILTSPAPPDIAVRLSRSPWLLNRRPGGPALCWVLFSLQHHFSNSSDTQNLIEFPVH